VGPGSIEPLKYLAKFSFFFVFIVLWPGSRVSKKVKRVMDCPDGQFYAPLPWSQPVAVVAVSANDVIGHNGAIPWKSPCDLRHFRRATHGKTVVMGYNTFKSLRCRALPGRRNVVLTRSSTKAAEITELGLAYVPSPPHEPVPEECVDRSSETTLLPCTSVDEVLALQPRHGADAVMIIGGESIYRQFLPHTACVLLTMVHVEIPDGDTYFPTGQLHEQEAWRLVCWENVLRVTNGPSLTFQRFERPGCTEPTVSVEDSDTL